MECHVSVDGHAGGFHFLVIMSNAVTVQVHVPGQVPVNPFVYKARCGNARSSGNFFEEPPNILHSGGPTFSQQFLRTPISPHSGQHMSFSNFFFIITNL